MEPAALTSADRDNPFTRVKRPGNGPTPFTWHKTYSPDYQILVKQELGWARLKLLQIPM